MPTNESPMAQAMKITTDNIRSRKVSSKDSDQLLFNQEELTKPQYLAGRWETMSKDERKQYIDTNGAAETMKQLRGSQ